MRIKITKPVDGVVSVTLDDRRGLTGMKARAKNVPVDKALEWVSTTVETWHARRNEMIATRKGRSK